MFSYLLLNLVFLAGLSLFVLLNRRLIKDCNSVAKTLIALLVMTAVFDSIIIALGLVTYDTSKILGIYIGKAPIEDFFYALAGVMLIPVLWQRGANHEKDK